MIAAEAKGLRDVIQKVTMLKRASSQSILSQAATTAAQAALIEKIRAKAPVKTGALRDSIYISPVPVGQGDQGLNVKSPLGYIVVDKFYARFIEYGTDRQAAHPFVRPVLDAELAEFYQTFAKVAMRGIEIVLSATGQWEISIPLYLLGKPIENQIAGALQAVGGSET